MDNPAHASASNTPSVNNNDELKMLAQSADGSRVTVDQLLMAGAHFGHITRRWNPKMKKYIFMARNGIYLLDLNKTQTMLESACREIARLAVKGEEILFVGTKKAAHEIVETEARRANAHYVTFRWLGGTLTNFATIRRSIKTLESYEKMATDGTYDNIGKKEQLTIEKAKQKLMRTLGGIREMRRLPGAVYIVDTMWESIAVSEARKLGIPVFAIVDTNVDPDLVDFPIPANDDAFKSIWLITRAIADAAIEGSKKFKEERAETKEEPETRAEQAKTTPDRHRRRRRPRGGGGNRPPRDQAKETATGGKG